MEENYIVSARKYRPATFSSVVGQKALTATLRNAIATGRLAHAYLFCGTRGVGKTTTARIFAKTINCEHPTPQGDPCNECESCRAFNDGRSLNIIELDAASHNSVDDIRQLTDQVLVQPTTGKYKVFIVDEVHMLSSAAFNAFLKTLEEPPSYVVFILATTEKQKILPTILSRCQIYDFSRITITDIVDHLEYVASQEGYTTERAALNVIAQKADGAMRDALSIFDQVAASSRGNLTYQAAIDNLNVLDEGYYSRLVDAFAAADVAQALLIYKEIRDHGFDSQFFINGLGGYLRNLMVAHNPATLALLDTDQSVKEQLAEKAKRLDLDFYYSAMSLCNEADLNYRQATNKTFLVELLLIRLCQQVGPSPIYSGGREGHALQPLPSAATPQSQSSTPVTPSTPATPPPAREPKAPQEEAKTPETSSAAPAKSRVTAPSLGRRHVSLKMASTSSTDNALAPDTSDHNAPAPRQAQYSDAQFRAAWQSYIDQHPRQVLLVNAMRPARLERNQDERWTMTVENDLQVQTVDENTPALLEYLRQQLDNDHISLTTRVNQGPAAPSAWSDRELLQHIVETAPATARLISDLKLQLS